MNTVIKKVVGVEGDVILFVTCLGDIDKLAGFT